MNIKSFFNNPFSTPNKEVLPMSQSPASTPSLLMSPKIGRKANLNTVQEAQQTTKVDLISNESLDNQNESNQLTHINKSRAKRPNVKKPMTKNPYSNIEIETQSEDLSLANNNNNSKVNNKSDDVVDPEAFKQSDQVNNLLNEQSSNDSEQNKKVSPTVNANKSNLFPEQPRIK